MICLINEFKKIWNVKTIIILTLILAIINIIYVGAEGTNSKSDWKSVAKENRQLDEEYLKEFERFEEYDQTDYELYQKTVDDITIIDYSLENDIPYGNYSAWDHILNVQNLVMLFVLILLIYGCKIVGCEYDCGTWKNVLMHCPKRNRIIITKIVYAIIQTFLLVIFVHIIGLIIGSICYGNLADISQLTVSNGNVLSISVLPEILRSMVLIFIQACFFIFTGFFINMLTGKSRTALIISFALLVFSGNIENLVEKVSFHKLLPFYWMNKTDYSLSASGEWMSFLITMIVYIIILVAADILIFNKKGEVS